MQRNNTSTENTNQTASMGATFVRLMRILGGRLWLYLAMVLIMTVSHAIYMIASSYLLKDILDMAQSGNADLLWQKTAVNVAVGIGAILIWRFATINYNVEAKRGIARLEKAVFAKAIRLPMSYYDNHHSGDFISKLLFDTSKAGDVFGSRFRRLVAPAITVVVYFVPMALMCFELALALLGVSLVTLIFNMLYIKPMKNIGTQISKQNSSLSEKLTNLISAVDLTKMFGAGRKLSQDYCNDNDAYQKKVGRQNSLSAQLDGISFALRTVCTLLFIVIGVHFLLEGSVTLGSLAAVDAMYGAFNWNFLQLGRYMPEMTNSLVNARRVFEFLDREEEKKGYPIEGVANNALKPQDNYIVMEKIGFAYNEERKAVEEFSMCIRKGECVALTGTSGKGKSTVTKLLLGFYEPQQGRITIAGRAYNDYTLRQIREMIAYVPQEPYLYGVSIAQNIAYGKPGATKEEVIAAAKAAQAHDFIIKLENGYDTVAGERGSRLSGGEKQRIAIARAILKNAPILILDEATSALDNESEQLVSEAIEHLMKNRTTIMIAHRPSTIARADRVITM